MLDKSKYTGKKVREVLITKFILETLFKKTYFDINITDNDIIIYKDEGYTEQIQRDLILRK